MRYFTPQEIKKLGQLGMTPYPKYRTKVKYVSDFTQAGKQYSVRPTQCKNHKYVLEKQTPINPPFGYTIYTTIYFDNIDDLIAVFKKGF